MSCFAKNKVTHTVHKAKHYISEFIQMIGHRDINSATVMQCFVQCRSVVNMLQFYNIG